MRTKRTKILLLGCDAACGLPGELQAVLDSCPGQDFEIVRETFKACAKPSGAGAPEISRTSPDIVLLALPTDASERARALIPPLRRGAPGVPLMVVFEAAGPDETFGVLKLGADDFVTPPLRAADLLPRIWRLVEQSRRKETLVRTLKERHGLEQLVGRSRAFLDEVKKIPLMSRCDATVLISGETGTGKELCARAIHHISPRAPKPFVPVNCGALPVELMESELFGHERGAFTGAATLKRGLIHEVEGGTLFLDEIDCFPLLAQVKLLRFLQQKEYRPLGSTKTRKADVRIIAATNIDLEKAVLEGRFRQDLFYRLNIIPLALPPLRNRPEDIVPLAQHFLEKYADEFGKGQMELSPDAVQTLMLYDWPGNVRELEHVVERTVVLCEHQSVCADDIALASRPAPRPDESFQEAKNKIVAQFERAYILELLLAHRGNITEAAKTARKNRRAFFELIRKHKIDASAYKPEPAPARMSLRTT